MLVDTKEFFKCETCRHQKYYGCNTFCDAGEGYSPDVSKLTAVDAVEVVRCKDCKHWKPSGSYGGNSIEDMQRLGGCPWSIGCRRENDFCSYGEREE